MEAIESALIVRIAEAEPVVSRWRAELDRAAGWGVPAHVTVLYPFLPPAALDGTVRQRLAAAFASVPVFQTSFDRVQWFDRDVVWLAPEPDDGFRLLTAAAMATFPGVLPYGGQHGDEPTPHLTVGDSGGPARLAVAEQQVAARLPVAAAVREVSLLTGAPEAGSWGVRATFPLG